MSFVSSQHESSSVTESSFSRRSLARGAAWAAPSAVMAVTAPALAVSLRKDPGINGWVNNSYQVGSCWASNSRITVSSRVSGVGPDGAPFGLYLYDAEDVKTVSNAQLTYWVLGNHSASGSTQITWTSLTGHSSCWLYQGRVGTEQKPDGQLYTGYRWTYTCSINPADIARDGRLYLGDFTCADELFPAAERLLQSTDFLD